MNAGIVFTQMMVILLVILAGFAAQRLGMISPENKRMLSAMVVNVFNPALIISSVGSNTAAGGRESVLKVFLAATVMYVLLISAAWLLTRRAGKGREEKAVLQLMYIFSNLAFIGIPVIRAALGDGYIIYVAVFMLGYTVLIYTYGMYLIKDEEGGFSAKEMVRSVVNAGTVSAVVGLLLFFLGLSLPYVLSEALNYLGSVATPISLMVIGVTLGEEEDLWAVLKNKKLYGFCAIKMLFLPLLACLLLKLSPLPEDLGLLTLIMTAMPAGSLPLMFLSEKGWDGEFCSEGIILTTLLSALTIPLMVLIYQHI